MNILDETVGATNWQRSHSRDNTNCTVSIWDEDKKQWISKEDTGTESYTEKEKGKASDSFKRACFNWGIGRELYTSPFIWVSADKCNIVSRNGKYACNDKFLVSHIGYDDKRNIISLTISNDTKRVVAYPPGNVRQTTDKPREEPVKVQSPLGNDLKCSNCGASISEKVAKWSNDKFGRPLCMECQKKVK